MDFGCFKPFMDNNNNNNNNSHLDYFHDNNIYQVCENSGNGVVLGDSLYGISSSQLGYSFYNNNAHTMMVHKMEDEAYNMPNMVPSITPKFSFPISSSSSTALMEDRFLGFRQNNGANNMVVKAVRKNIKRSKKKTNMVKGQWTLEEDRRLIKLVEKHGIRKWSHIAQMLPGRIGKQCRERWHNHLRPNIKKDSWTEDEDRVLIEAHKEVGNKWAEIAKRLPGRTENSLKNHWNTTKRRQFARRRRRTAHTPKNSTGGATTILQDYIKSLGIVNSIGGGGKYVQQTERIDQAEAEVKVDNNDLIIPSYDLFADMYSLLFDENDLDLDHLLLTEKCGNGGGSIDVMGGIVFDNMDEVIMDIKWDDEVFVGAGDGDGTAVVMPGSNEIVVKKEMDLLEMISQSSGGSNCVGSWQE